MVDFIATETELVLALTQDRGDAPFLLTLTRTECRWHADGYSEVDVTVVDEHVLYVPLPAVFDMANDWLLAQHRAAVLPPSWTVDVSDRDNLVAFKGRVFPAAAAAEDTAVAAPVERIA